MFLSLGLSALAILFTWTLFDILMHRLLLRPLYEQHTGLWRPFAEMNVVLIYTATFTLIAVFVLTYWLLISPKSFSSGVGFGTLFGVALGTASGLGTYIHMPIPRALAWGWLIGGCLRGVLAGAILGALITSS
jgi:hypothetical protein